MTRRSFLSATASLPLLAGEPPLAVPVYRVFDKREHDPKHLQRFRDQLWPQAVRDFGRGGIRLDTTDGAGEVKLTAADRPILVGLRRSVLNLMLTDHIPMYWDNGRSWAGVTTIYDGYHVCMIALRFAHGDQAPFVSVNTCVHELLHALMLDTFRPQPSLYHASKREYRIDWYASRMWIFHDGAAVRQSVQIYLRRLRAAAH